MRDGNWPTSKLNGKNQLQEGLVDRQGNSTTRMFNNLPEQGNRSASVLHAQSDKAVAIPQHRRIQNQIERQLSPLTQSLLDDGSVELQRLDSLVVEPATESPLPTLGHQSSGLNMVAPLSQADATSSKQPHHHPTQRLQVAAILPGRLTPQIAQFIIQTGGGFHDYSVLAELFTE